MYVIDPVAMVTDVLTLHLNFIESASVSFRRENFSRRVSKSHRCPGGHFPGGGGGGVKNPKDASTGTTQVRIFFAELSHHTILY